MCPQMGIVFTIEKNYIYVYVHIYDLNQTLQDRFSRQSEAELQSKHHLLGCK